MSITDIPRKCIERELRMLDLIEATQHASTLDVDPLGPVTGTWTYREPVDIAMADDETRRQAALEWLARHARFVQQMIRLSGSTVTLEKRATEHAFGVYTLLPGHGAVHAYVPANLTCEFVETGEVRTVPERTEPVMERRCPPSIFAGIESEAVPS